MSGSVGAGERGVNSNRPVVHRLSPRRRPACEQPSSSPRHVFTQGRGWCSDARILPLRWCTTACPPGRGRPPRRRVRRTRSGSTGRWVQITAPSPPSSRSSTTSITDAAGRVLLAEPVVALELPAGRVGVRRRVCDAAGAARRHDPRDAVRRQQRHQPLRLQVAGLQRAAGAGRRARQDLRDRASACRSTTSARRLLAALGAPPRACRGRAGRSAPRAPCRAAPTRPRRSRR